MKQKLLGDILYVFSIEPYVITNDTDAEVIKVQQECYDGYVELNPDLAEKIVKYNYHMITVTQQEWAPYVDAPGSVLQVNGINWHDNVYININGELVENQSYYELQPGDEIEIGPANYQNTIDYYVSIDGGVHAVAPVEGKWTFTMGEDELNVSINYHQAVTLSLVGNVDGSTLIVTDREGNSIYVQPTYEMHLGNTYVEINFVPRADHNLYAASATYDERTWELLFNGHSWPVNLWGLASEVDELTVDIQYNSNKVEIAGTDILENINVEINGVLQTEPQEYYYDVSNGTVFDIYPTENTEDYELISGATWDTDHWTATCDGSDLTITINYLAGPGPQPIQTITVIAPYDLAIYDEEGASWVEMQQTGWDPTLEHGAIVPGKTYSVEQRSGIGQGMDVTFSPACGTGQQGTVGAEFIAPNQDMTITLSQPQPQPTYSVYLNGSDIHQHSTIYFDNVQQQMDAQWDNVPNGTVVDLYPTDNVIKYDLISGATWDTDHWTATVNGTYVDIVINYNEFITVTATYGLIISDLTAGEQIAMSQDPNDPTIATGTLTIGNSCEIDQTQGAGQNMWPRFSPSCSYGYYGSNGEEFAVPGTSLTITLDSTPDISWSSASATVDVNDVDPSYPTLSNSNNYSISYDSTDQLVATIDQSTGEITLLSAGSTTIKALVTPYWSATPTSIDYTLTVTNIPSATEGVTVTYNVNNTSQAATIWCNNGDVPDQMFVDGESKTVADTYQFSTTGSHTIQYVFNDHILDINFQLSDPTTPVEITGFQVGSDIEEVAGNSWAVKTFNTGASDMVDVEQTYLPTTPPTITGLGESGDRPGATIYVPSDSVTAYQAASVWSDISALIQAIPVQ